jgi:hypothetical protein
MSVYRSRERRRHGAECLAAAKQTSNFRVRAFLVEMAWKWFDLAELDEWDNLHQALSLRAIQTKIGQELRAQYELPYELPHGIVTLLMQINAPQNRESRAPIQAAKKPRNAGLSTQTLPSL